ncbi:MAG TPA: carbamoyl-phosphate synthase large subunit [Candidatus Avalokitesvara rifleensis]|uniref:carbamoyl-phosphate synthase large subunit n=1 Tax=Candidatus Avalokitesvara rifleensis TaxID=3367620 RepID=UPI0040292862
MPKRTDIQKILIIGSGPIVIGQACEFDYSGTQACKALREEGFHIVLVNSNPATIMTDPELADATYIEPLIPDVLERIIEKERPQALLPTLGGQTALNLAVNLAESGVLRKYNVELIGAGLEAIKKAEDRSLFKDAMIRIGIGVPESYYVKTLEEAIDAVKNIGFPAIIRPSFTLGGTGGSIAMDIEEYKELITRGLDLSPVHEILVERSIIGWKEYELEVMRDGRDNVVIICSIENLDPMGIHTGDSITVAPAQTLTDREYQHMRDAAIKIIREIGVDTGGSNIQFAVNPDTGEMLAIEMNPRVSRSSALASKATGFPIAKIAAKLAVGYTLDEIPNDITRSTPASFEPTIDYCVVKYPRFNFEKFPGTDERLTTQMKSVGEVMAIGRTFKEALGKAVRSLEIDLHGLALESFRSMTDHQKRVAVRDNLSAPRWDRLWYVAEGLRAGISIDELYGLTKIDPWFLHNIKEIIDVEDRVRFDGLNPETLREAKATGISDNRLAQLTGSTESSVRTVRHKHGIRPVFKRVDTCAAEFRAYTPYLYSTYETECEAEPTDKKKVIILGSGPNRIGQGIEFDYCCVHSVMALRQMGYETIMVNCNPETVSTDYDTSDRLYFEPLTLEDTLEITAKENPLGVIVQFGGQTPLKLAVPLEKEGIKILGTSPDDIDRAEDRERFARLLKKLDLKQPENGSARSLEEAVRIAEAIGYPILLRPSYILGGRAMQVAFDRESLEKYIHKAAEVSPGHPVLVDKFLEDAVEVDVDAVADGEDVLIGGVMEHIEAAGIHSGDSSCAIPPHSLKADILEELERQTRVLALELNVKGLVNIQYAVKDGEVFVLEVNPRASRTVPFVSKAIGIPLAKVATKAIMGVTLREMGLHSRRTFPYTAVKEAVLPFIKFPGADTILGPEMKSTGEVMGLDRNFGKAYAKSQMGQDGCLPTKGTVFISVKEKDKPHAVDIARTLHELGFRLMATRGTASAIAREGLPVQEVLKVFEGSPNVVDYLKRGEINLVINTTEGNVTEKDSFPIRRTALVYRIPYFTTLSGACAAARAIEAMLKGQIEVRPLQEYYSELAGIG